MKKIFCIIVLFISVAISASAQKKVSDIKEGFENGCFYLMDKEFYVMFQAVETCQEKDGKIKSAVFETVADSESMEKGEKWFKEKMEGEDSQAAMFDFFYDNINVVIGDDYKVTEDGRARVSMTLME